MPLGVNVTFFGRPKISTSGGVCLSNVCTERHHVTSHIAIDIDGILHCRAAPCRIGEHLLRDDIKLFAPPSDERIVAVDTGIAQTTLFRPCHQFMLGNKLLVVFSRLGAARSHIDDRLIEGRPREGRSGRRSSRCLPAGCTPSWISPSATSSLLYWSSSPPLAAQRLLLAALAPDRRITLCHTSTGDPVTCEGISGGCSLHRCSTTISLKNRPTRMARLEREAHGVYLAQVWADVLEVV